MTVLIQPSMAAGEVSLPVAARVDLAKRAVAVESAENFVATISGSMDTRAGQEFVSRSKDATRLIPFEFSAEETYVLEFGDFYMRVLKDGVNVLDSGTTEAIEGITQADPAVVTITGHTFQSGEHVSISGVVGMEEVNGRIFRVSGVTTNTFSLQDADQNDIDSQLYGAWASGGSVTTVYEIETPYAKEDLFDIRYAQSADVMAMTHKDYEERELIRLGDSWWIIGIIDMYPEQVGPTDMSFEVNTDTETKAITGITQANPAVVTAVAHGYATGDQVLITDNNGMQSIKNFVYKIVVLSVDTFSLKSSEDGTPIDSTGFLAYTSGGICTKVIRMRKYAVTALNDTTGEESLRAPIAAGLSIRTITQAKPAVITMWDGHGLQVFDEVYLDGLTLMSELNGYRYSVRPVTEKTFELLWPNGDPVDTTALDPFTVDQTNDFVYPLFLRVVESADVEWNNTIRWEAAEGAALYNIYASTGGDYGYIGSTDKLQFIDDHIGPDTAFTPPRSRDPFRDDGTGDRYPKAVGFHEQRRVFGYTDEFPNRFFMTKIGNLYNFAGSYPTQDDDPIIATLASLKVASIEHILPLTDLVLLTSGGEFRVFSQTGALTPSTIQIKPQSYYGSTKLRPILAGEVGMFVSHGAVVRDFSYGFADDKFVGKDLTVLARHLFRGHTIVDWGFASAPYSVVWAVRDDGVLLSLTYMPEQDIYAWAHHTTYGEYLSVAVVKENGYDVPYFLVRRTLNGVTQKTVERLRDHEFTDLHDAFCVDAGLTFESEAFSITGMTDASPVVVTTSSAHGFSNGDTVDISGVFEVDESLTTQQIASPDYNGSGFTIANVTSTTFELQFGGVDYNGSGFAGYSYGGVVRKAVTTVEGLWHLEGATVVAAANGKSVKDLVVTNGAITLPDRASRVHVGLPYTPRLITLPLSTYADGQTSVGKYKNVSKLTVQLERSMGMWSGPTLDQMREARFPAVAGHRTTQMFNEDLDVTLKSDWDKRKQIIIEQRDPLPLSILALVPDLNIGGN